METVVGVFAHVDAGNWQNSVWDIFEMDFEADRISFLFNSRDFKHSDCDCVETVRQRRKERRCFYTVFEKTETYCCL